MSEKEDNLCEAYYSIEEQGLDKGRKITIQGKAKTPEDAFNLMMRIKKEVDK